MRQKLLIISGITPVLAIAFVYCIIHLLESAIPFSLEGCPSSRYRIRSNKAGFMYKLCKHTYVI